MTLFEAGAALADDALTVAQVYRKSKNALAREFRSSLWVTGEIKNIREWRGNWYLSLVDPGTHTDGGDISLDIACWPKRRLVLEAQLREAGITLAAGMQVRVCGALTVSRLGKLQVELTALDTQALIGAQALERKKLYDALATEGLLERNKRLEMALVPLRVGLVTSDGSDGCRDFLEQLMRSGYDFRVTLAHAPVQGPAAPSALARAIQSLTSTDIDVIAVVRGGGGELDAFDKEPVARAIATSPHPVWTGIGHTADHAVADDVAHRAFITPTECGQGLVECVHSYLDTIELLLQRVHRHATRDVSSANASLSRTVVSLDRHLIVWPVREQQRIGGAVTHLARTARHVATMEQQLLSHRLQACSSAAERSLDRHRKDIDGWQAQLRLLDPRRQLQRGYSLTRSAAGTVVTDALQLKPGEPLVIDLARGSLDATVDHVHNVHVEEPT